MLRSGRIELLDFARGIALLAMTIFHFAFDLELLGIEEPGFISQPHWKYFARIIASSFLFLVGFGLFLAHGNGVRWPSWRWRMLKIVAAALLITIATLFATPNQFIFFGILHSIAFASVAGLFFLSVPVAVLTGAAAAVFVIGAGFETSALDHWIWWWSGLSETRIVSSDYVPVFPWLSAPLLGMACAKLMSQKGWLEALAIPELASGPSRLVKFIGRHSLVYYLLHQPVMIALIYSFLFATGRVAF